MDKAKATIGVADIVKSGDKAALTAAKAFLRANGLALVAVDPTEKMKLTGARSIRDSMDETNFTQRAISCWQDMISER